MSSLLQWLSVYFSVVSSGPQLSQPHNATVLSKATHSSFELTVLKRCLQTSMPMKISTYSALLTLITSWRQNIAPSISLTETLTMLYKIENVYFNKTMQPLNYKGRNQITKRKYSRVLPGYFSISWRKSLNLLVSEL